MSKRKSRKTKAMEMRNRRQQRARRKRLQRDMADEGLHRCMGGKPYDERFAHMSSSELFDGATR